MDYTSLGARISFKNILASCNFCACTRLRLFSTLLSKMFCKKFYIF